MAFQFSDKCITCHEPVRPRQEGIQCDGCGYWNHRTCGTGKFFISAVTCINSLSNLTALYVTFLLRQKSITYLPPS